MFFEPQNTMQILIFRFEYKLISESCENTFIFLKNIQFYVYSSGVFKYIVCHQNIRRVFFFFKKILLLNFCISGFFLFFYVYKYLEYEGP